MKNRYDVSKRLVEKMFEIAGHVVTYEDLAETPNWYSKWSMTYQQQREWMEWGAEYLSKELGLPKYLAERKMDLFNFNYGLTMQKEKLQKH